MAARASTTGPLRSPALLLTFRRNCVVDHGQLPSSAALYPHMSESKGKGGARRIGRSSDFWIPRVDADVLDRLLSGNNYRVTEVAYHDVAPVKREPPSLPRLQQGRHWPVILV